MKTYLSVVSILKIRKRVSSLFVIAILFYHHTFAQTGSTIDPLAQCVLNTLRSTNDSLIYQCLPDKDGFEWIQQMARKEQNNPAINTDSLANNIQTGALQNIRRIRDKFKSKEIDISNIKVDSIIQKPVTLFDLKSVVATNITIYFTSGETAYQLKISRCILINNEWKLMDKISLWNN